MLLAIDTATDCCSVALGRAGEVRERIIEHPRQHAAGLLPLVDELLAEAGCVLGQLDAIAFGRGPGSFTGLRIAVSMTQGLAFAANLPVLPISTLAAVAQEGFESAGLDDGAHCLAALDARMGEVYTGLFRRESGLAVAVAAAGERLCRPQHLQLPAAVALAAGSGWRCEGMPPAPRTLADCQPRARSILVLAERAWRAGEQVSAEQALPVYLRNDVTG